MSREIVARRTDGVGRGSADRGHILPIDADTAAGAGGDALETVLFAGAGGLGGCIRAEKAHWARQLLGRSCRTVVWRST